MQLWSRYTE